VFRKIALSLIIGLLVCSYSAFAQAPQERIIQPIIINGLQAQGVLVVQNGTIQSQRRSSTSLPINLRPDGHALSRQRECGCFMRSRRYKQQRHQRSFTSSPRRSTSPHQPSAIILSAIRITATATSSGRASDSASDSAQSSLPLNMPPGRGIHEDITL